MCGIGGILRVVSPSDRAYPRDAADPLRRAADPWRWQGPAVDPRDVPRTRGDQAWLIPDEQLDVLDRAVAWRGPDGAGRFRHRVVRPDGALVEVALVHRRLAIIDLACGGQPMVLPPAAADSSGLLAIVFNGCIYNHRELRRRLEAEGVRFTSDHSDTETLLAAWGRRGPACLNDMDAMFAFALWDAASATLYLARDRFGEKPLYVSTQAGLTVFASVPINPDELSAKRSPVAIDGERLALWASRGWAAHPPQEAAESVTPGRVLALGAPPSQSAPAVDLSAVGTARPARAAANLLDQLEDALSQSVAARLDADVPVGTFLSGGVDSAIITALAARRAPVLALTVRMPHSEYDESREAARSARVLGVRHEVLDCSPDAAADLITLIEHARIPLGDSSLLPTYWLCRAAAAHVKVALAGDGGDEIFMGYDRYRAVDLLRRWSRLLRLIPERRLRRADPRSRTERLARLIDAARGDGWIELSAIFPKNLRAALFGPGAEMLSSPWTPSSDADWARRLDIVSYLRHDLLRKTDIASMTAGVEVRCPFLSDRVKDLAFAVRARDHFSAREGKVLLRALARRFFPSEVVGRPKRGFAIPISDWFRSDFGGLRTLLLDMLAGEKPFGSVHDVLDIDTHAVRRLLDEHWAAGGLAPLHTARPVRPRDHGQRLFALLSLAVWARAMDRRRRLKES